jgi:hypothetical protein
MLKTAATNRTFLARDQRALMPRCAARSVTRYWGPAESALCLAGVWRLTAASRVMGAGLHVWCRVGREHTWLGSLGEQFFSSSQAEWNDPSGEATSSMQLQARCPPQIRYQSIQTRAGVKTQHSHLAHLQAQYQEWYWCRLLLRHRSPAYLLTRLRHYGTFRADSLVQQTRIPA